MPGATGAVAWTVRSNVISATLTESCRAMDDAAGTAVAVTVIVAIPADSGMTMMESPELSSTDTAALDDCASTRMV